MRALDRPDSAQVLSVDMGVAFASSYARDKVRPMTESAQADVFVHELPLVLEGAQERELEVAFDTARQAYNSLLGEALRRLDLMRERKAYRVACGARGRNRQAAFRQLRKELGFSQYELHGWASRHLTRSWLSRHLDTTVIRSMSQRAFTAANKHATGKRGRPRFKGAHMLDSFEGQSNAQGLRYQQGFVIWNGDSFPAPRKYRVAIATDPRTEHALALPILRVRIVRRRLGTTRRYWVQLIVAGRPFLPSDSQFGRGIVGIDPGPRTFAIFSEALSGRVDLAVPKANMLRAMRRIQRRIQRSLRANNPEKFGSDGRFRDTRTPWRRSASRSRNRARLADLHRRAAAGRKNRHGRLINSILKLGNDIRLEDNSFRSFQRQFGRSVANAAPAAFVRRLRHKAANAGASVVMISATLRLSQTCHGCGTVEKKPLDQRSHVCPCGIEAQRDLYSALLLAHLVPIRLVPGWRLDAGHLSERWPGVRSRLSVASSAVSVDEFALLADQAARCASGARPMIGTERFAEAVAAIQCEARDVVAVSARARESTEGRDQLRSPLEPDDSRSVLSDLSA